MSRPSISVVIPTYNRSEIVEQTLRHLDAQDYPPGQVEVLVVDNSTDDTPAMARRVDRTARIRIQVLELAERLPAVKRNVGLRAASGELVMFMNDDVWLAPQALEEHALTHAQQPGPVAVLGHVEQSRRMPQTPFIATYEPFAYHEISEGPVGYRHFWSMNLSMPRQTMLARNLVFHEDWAEIGNEDVELGYRWTSAGLPVIYNPRATGEHYHPHTVASAGRVQASIGRGLRDLEQLVDDPGLLERYGVFSLRNSPRAVTRGAARELLFNRWTVPALVRWLDGRDRPGRLSSWMYWKVLLHHTNAGYRAAPSRRVPPTPTFSADLAVTR